jgi:hypothetical protein
VKKLQTPARQFVGNQPIEATNADRALSPTLPPFNGRFDDVFELPCALLTGAQNQLIAVDMVEPGVAPVRVTGRDRVLAEKVFAGDVPWIIVSLVETPLNL